MTTHPTLEAARQTADRTIVSIIEVTMESGERAYLQCKATLAGLRGAIAKSGKGLPGVATLVAEHTVRTPKEIEAAHRAELRDHCHCERCGAKLDGNTAYSQQEWDRLGGARVKVRAYYCTSCTALLTTIGAGERTAMQERAAAVPPVEPYTKQD